MKWRGNIKDFCCFELWIYLTLLDHVTTRGGSHMSSLLWHLYGPCFAVMQPQLLQGLSEALLGPGLTWMSRMQEKNHQVQSSLQSGSEKCLWGRSAGQEAEFNVRGGEDELQSTRGEAETLLSGWQTAHLCGVSVIESAQNPRLLACRRGRAGL